MSLCLRDRERLVIRLANRRFGVVQRPLTPEQVKAGTGRIRTYAEWEQILKRAEFGVSHLFTEDRLKSK
ncbi:hypothetical protein [Nostoc sp. FACHB-110]|uniref:hypothetical protein n=1 Tax=Nostoc sp. FACHB-110 TaxID=2692834 RepID=UPI001687020C|nr:hypothetical protein [Nostoc sp. FACHB-110]MBD2439911.1 hypothetical protein [Nostoc sp. FACHB-110]